MGARGAPGPPNWPSGPDVLLVCIDTATPEVSVAIGDDGAVRGEVRLGRGRRHAEQLAPAIEYLCRELDVELARLAGIAVGLGPGLFTGLRVGVTTAKTMAQALRVPVVGVASLDLVAYPLRHTSRLVAAVLDARRGEVFHARYRPVPGGVQRVTDYEVGSPADLVADLVAAGDEVLFAGDCALRYRDELAEVDRSEQAGPAFAFPSGAALVELATARMEREDFSSGWDVRPLYLRQSDAEIEWERREAL
jgi:tRNA threonylcarbamoyladenosine biosynthesis protein TsaB